MFVWFWKLFHGSYSGFCCQLVASAAIPAFSKFGTSFKPIYTYRAIIWGIFYMPGKLFRSTFRSPWVKDKVTVLEFGKYLSPSTLFVSPEALILVWHTVGRSFNVRKWQNPLHTPIASISNNAAFGNRIMYQWFLWPLCNCCYMRMPFLGHGT